MGGSVIVMYWAYITQAFQFRGIKVISQSYAQRHMQEDNFFVRMEPKDVNIFILVVFNPILVVTKEKNPILVVENIFVI